MFLNKLFKNNLQKNKEIYEQYLHSKIAKSLDTVDTTYKTYQSNMKLFLEWFHKYDKGYYLLERKMLEEFPEIIDRFSLYCLQVRGNNKVTVNNKIVALSSFYIWARRNRKILFNPVLDIERQQKWRQDKRRNSYFLTIEQVKHIKKIMNENPQKYDLRSRLIFYIFIDSAIRIGEMTRLSINNLNIEKSMFVGIKQKGGELRNVNLSTETFKLLNEYLEWRKKENVIIEQLLVTKYNKGYKAMSKETIRARIKEIGKIVGIDDLYPHSLRKTVINIITKLGSIEDGALIAHHKNTAVTREHYVEELTDKEKIIRIEKLRKLAEI